MTDISDVAGHLLTIEIFLGDVESFQLADDSTPYVEDAAFALVAVRAAIAELERERGEARKDAAYALQMMRNAVAAVARKDEALRPARRVIDNLIAFIEAADTGKEKDDKLDGLLSVLSKIDAALSPSPTDDFSRCPFCGARDCECKPPEPKEGGDAGAGQDTQHTTPPQPVEPPAGADVRRQGRSKFVYDKEKRTIITVMTPAAHSEPTEASSDWPVCQYCGQRHDTALGTPHAATRFPTPSEPSEAEVEAVYSQYRSSRKFPITIPEWDSLAMVVQDCIVHVVRTAARVRAPQEDGWQDISTLSLPIPEGRGHMVDLHVRGLHRQYRMPNVWRDHGEWCYVSEGPKVLTIRDDLVTHWRPLPAAPPAIARAQRATK